MHGGLYAKKPIITKNENKIIQSMSILNNKLNDTPNYIITQKTKKIEDVLYAMRTPIFEDLKLKSAQI